MVMEVVLLEQPEGGEPPKRPAFDGIGPIPWTTPARPSRRPSEALARLLVFVVSVAVLIAGGLSVLVPLIAPPYAVYDATSTSATAFEARTGIHVLGVSLTLGGSSVAVRYRVLNGALARRALEDGVPILVDERSGAELGEPVVRPSRRPRLRPFRTYSIHLENTGSVVGPDSLVTVVIRDARLEHVPVG